MSETSRNLDTIVGSIWLTLEYMEESEKNFRCVYALFRGVRWIVSLFTKEIRPICLFFVMTGVYGGTRHGGNREIGVVIDGRISMYYLSFTYSPVSTVSFAYR